MSQVFVDTSAIYAVLDADDAAHETAKDAWGGLVESDALMVTSNYILVETCALLQSRIGTAAVKVFSEDIVPLLEVHWINKNEHGAAASAHSAVNRRHLSLVDCTSFEVMRRRGVASVFTFDHHFQQFGFTLLPKP